MTLRAPVDGVVSVVVAEVGEDIRAGQPTLMIEATGEQRLSFNVHEDHRLTIGETVSVMRHDADEATTAVITKLRPLGLRHPAGRAGYGCHDRDTLRLRLDAEVVPASLGPGMAVWIAEAR
jgi:HlyD family secretion protein